jgi:hypothetical protein
MTAGIFSTPAIPRRLLLPSNMSDEIPSSPAKSTKPEGVPRVRRISTPRPKKTAKATVTKEPASPILEMPVAAEITAVPASAAEPAEVSERSTDQAEAGWPEPEAATGGGEPGQGEPVKRKRRRRKGKGSQGGGNPTGAPVAEEEAQASATTEPRAQEVPQEPRQRPASAQQQQQQHAPRAKLDPELVTKMAWKIYLAEVSEEGVALIGDNDAKDLSRRCFRLAEIFIEEQRRR